MDFADASLVHVAAREGVSEMFTLDTRDFSVYRLQSALQDVSPHLELKSQKYTLSFDLVLEP